MLFKLSLKKEFPLRSFSLFILFVFFIVVGSVQTEIQGSRTSARVMKQVIQSLSREKAGFLAELGSISGFIESLAENPRLINETARLYHITLDADEHSIVSKSLQTIPSGKELYSIFRMMADRGLLDRQEKVNVADTMRHIQIMSWNITQLPDKVKKKIIAIYTIAQSSAPEELVSALIKNNSSFFSLGNLFKIDPKNMGVPGTRKNAAGMEIREKAQLAYPPEIGQEFPRQSWARTYGGILNGGAKSIQQTDDGGYIVAGYDTSLLGPTGYDFWILKLSSSGRTEWQKTYGGNGPDRALSIQQTIDGGYVIAGYISPSTLAERGFCVLKLDSAGDIEWQRAYGGSDEDWPTSIQQTSDGGYIIAGITTSFGAGDYDFWILKLSASGDIEWQKAYGGSSFDSAQAIQQTSDGGFIIAGYTSSFGAGGSDIWILKLNHLGDIEWQRTYGGAGSEWTDSIQQTTDGGYIVSGYTSSFDNGTGDIWVLKLFPSGDIDWQRVFKGNSADGAHSVQQTDDSGYIVAGFTESFGGGRRDVWVLKLSSFGNVEWERAYGNSGDDWAHSIQQTGDGGYIIAGKTIGLLGAGSGDFLIIKLDSSGNIERVPELVHSSNAEVFDTAVTPLNTSITPQTTDASSQVPLIKVEDTDVTGHLLFSPPAGLTGTKLLNRSLSQAEYINILTWADNPNNDDLNISKYRIYLRDVEWYGTYLLAEVDADISEFMHENNIWKDKEYRYIVTGVNEENEEGIPALVTVR